MKSIKDELLERAAYNGRKAAEYYFNKDYRTGKTYSDNTKDLARSYPAYSQEIHSAHNTAYTEFNKTHRH